MHSSSRIRSVSQWVLYDPAERVTDSSMQAAEPSELDLEMVSELVRQSEIDFRTLKAHVRAILARQSQVSIAQVLAEYPAEQGLGSVVGYVALRSEEQPSELQSLMRISYAGFCLNKKNTHIQSS